MPLSHLDLDLTHVQRGKRYRVTTTFDDGSINTFEGVIHDVINIPSRHALVHWSGSPGTRGGTQVVGEIVPGVKDVKITKLSDPLPIRSGTIIRHLCQVGGREDVRRVLLVLIEDKWIEPSSGAELRRVVDPEWELLYAPE